MDQASTKLSRSMLGSLLTILSVLRRSQPRGKQGVLWAAAATAAGLLLRHLFSTTGSSKYITNPARVGRRVIKDKVDGKEVDGFNEFDVIIVGGGVSCRSRNLHFSFLTQS